MAATAAEAKRKGGGLAIFSPLKVPVATTAAKNKKYRCYYPYRSRDSLSPICGIFLKI